LRSGLFFAEIAKVGEIMPKGKKKTNGEEDFRPIFGIGSGGSPAAVGPDELKSIMKSVPELTDEELTELKRRGASTDGVSNERLMAMALLEKALAGNISAIEYIDKRLGLHPETALKERKMVLSEKELQGDDKEQSRAELKEVFAAVEEDENGIGSNAEGVNEIETPTDDNS